MSRMRGTSDQLCEYRTALQEVYGIWEQPGRRGERGRFPGLRLVPHPDLLHPEVVKQREHGRVVAVSTTPVFGRAEAIAARLENSPSSTSINPSFVERENLTLRQHNRRLTRRTNGFSTALPWLEKQLWLCLAYYHLVLPHQSLRQELDPHEPTRGAGSPRRWRSITPATAAGLTDHVWSTSELLSYRVPESFLDTMHSLHTLFPPLEVHQGR